MAVTDRMTFSHSLELLRDAMTDLRCTRRPVDREAIKGRIEALKATVQQKAVREQKPIPDEAYQGEAPIGEQQPQRR